MKTRINNVKKGVVTLLFAAVIAGLTACETDPVKSQRGELPDKDLLENTLRHRMLRARERRGEREPRTAGRTLTVRPCKEKKKGPSLTTRTFFFGGEPPPPKMRFNRRYSTAERVPPLWS